MNGYLIAEEGPLAGMILSFEEGAEDQEWVLGRDPEGSAIVLEDPMVSRKHVIIKATAEGFVLENLSTVNPATQNGMVIAEPVLLKEGDIIQIGSTFFHFTTKTPVQDEPKPQDAPAATETPTEPGEMSDDLHFGPDPDTRWLLKVVSGPNSGAEFALNRNATYLVGKDPNICDVVFQDLSVSRQHARLILDGEDHVYIEDLGSRNGVIINGELIDAKHLINSQDLIALGTTTFIIIDRKEPRETVLSPKAALPTYETEKQKAAIKEKKDWKELSIPKRHLTIAGVLALVVLVSVFGMFSLFKTEPVQVVQVDYTEKLKEALEPFPGVEFSYNAPSGNLFLVGHVLTTVNHQELSYAIKELPFVKKVEDNVIVDELVWQNMNALFMRNPDWAGISMHSPVPGRFILRGYVETLEEAVALNDYVNLNFNYLDQLSNEVVIEKNLQTEIESLLISHNLSGVAFELINGDLVLSGRVGKKENKTLQTLIQDLRRIPGIREVKSFVVITTATSSRVDLTKDFKVTGYSMRDDMDYFVVINGRILTEGDLLEGMLITKIEPKLVLLEKEGQKFKIDYNLQ